jgi:hypothetical protein
LRMARYNLMDFSRSRIKAFLQLSYGSNHLENLLLC